MTALLTKRAVFYCTRMINVKVCQILIRGTKLDNPVLRLYIYRPAILLMRTLNNEFRSVYKWISSKYLCGLMMIWIFFR